MVPLPLRMWLKNTETSRSEKALFCFSALTFFFLPLGTSPPLITGGISVAIWIFSGIAIEKRNIYKNAYWLPVYCLFCLSWIGLLYSPDPSGLGLDYARKTYYWLFGLSVAAISFQKFSPTCLVNAFMMGLGANVLAAMAQIIFHLKDEHNWHRGLGPQYSTLSAYLIVGIMMSVYFFRKNSAIQTKICLMGLTLLYFVHLVILKSRAGYFALILISPFLVYSIFKTRKTLKTFAVYFFIILLIILSPVARERIIQTINEMDYHFKLADEEAWGKKYSQVQERFYLWRGAAKIIRQNPFFGVGTGGYQMAMKSLDAEEKLPAFTHPHNNFLYIATSYGLLGIVVFLWFLYSTMVAGWKNRSVAQGYMLFSVGVVIMLTGIFDTQIINSGSAVFFALVVGFFGSFSLPEKAISER